MAIIVSSKIREKLAEKHDVSEEEISQCFANREGRLLTDTREEHISEPPTLWFIAETYWGRRLKVVFVQKDDNIYIKTAYAPNNAEIRIYTQHGLEQ